MAYEGMIAETITISGDKGGEAAQAALALVALKRGLA